MTTQLKIGQNYKEIAERLYVYNFSHFTEIFKRVTYISPKEARENKN